MIRRHQRAARAGEFDTADVDLTLVIDVIQVQDREKTWIGAATTQMRFDIDALEQRTERMRRQPAHPFIEIAQDDLRPGHTMIVDECGKTRRLIAALENRRSEVH